MPAVNTRECALFLDLDGTLFDIQSTPGEVVTPTNLIDTLSALRLSFDGAIAIITGRRISDADRLLSPLQLIAAGVHGVQLRRSFGGDIETRAPSFPIELLHAITTLAASVDGVLIEPKGAAVAVHYRQAPDQCGFLGENLQCLVERYGQHLELSTGRMVYEIIPRAYSKGEAITVLLQLPVFQRRRPVMIGDDAPDVPALEMATRLGGVGLKVAGEYFPANVADFRSTAEVRSWLDRLASERRR